MSEHERINALETEIARLKKAYARLEEKVRRMEAEPVVKEDPPPCAWTFKTMQDGSTRAEPDTFQ